MYRIKNKNTGRFLFKGLQYGSYEEARRAVRSYIRALLKKGKDAGEYGFLDGISRNPTRLGKFKIVAVGA